MKWILVCFILFYSSSIIAESDHPWWRIWDSVDQSAGISERLFTSKEKSILSDYLRSQSAGVMNDDEHRKHQSNDKKNKKDKHNKGKAHKSLPPGLQKKVDRGGQLPPGWQKKVARGEVLDGDLYEISENLPKGILRQLENIEGTSVRKVEDRVVRILDSTGEILDVLTGR